MIYVVLYLAAIVLANILILLYNPDTVSMTWALVAETGISFFLIGLDLSIRDKLHDYWQNRNLWPKMVTLIVSGSLITIFFNLEALQIAFASCSAFLLAGLTDALIYQRLRKRRFWSAPTVPISAGPQSILWFFRWLLSGSTRESIGSSWGSLSPRYSAGRFGPS